MKEDLNIEVTKASSDDGEGDFTVNLKSITSNPVSLGNVADSLTSEQKFIILKRMQLGEIVSFEDLPVSATFMLEKMEKMTEEEAVEILNETLIEHDNDPNFPIEAYEFIEKLLDFRSNDQQQTKASSLNEKLSRAIEGTKSAEYKADLEAENDYYFNNIFDFSLQAKIEASLIKYWSPYPEVRAITDPFDDPTVICETWRAYVAGIIWVAISSFINQYFIQRFPSITLSASAAQLLIYPTGLALSILPKWTIPIYKNYKLDLNPGPWSNKEQMLSTMMVAITSTPYIEGPIFAQKMPEFYGQKWVTWGYQILLGLSTQFVGFGLAGIVRKFCIYPTKSVWPTIMPTVAINRALLLKEKKENINGWKISRYWYFFIVFGGSFVYFWLPGYLFTALSTFSWLTWIKPYNFNLAMVTGSNSGLGFNPFPTFDWNVLSVVALPLQNPAFNTMNSLVGALVGFVAVLGIYYSNYYWSAYLPMNSSGTFSNTGESYDITSILNEYSVLDEKKYQEYGPPFYSAGNLLVYGAFFASYPFTILYVFMTNWQDIKYAFRSLWESMKNFRKSSLEGYDDPHSKMMREYPEVPEWVFLIVLIVAIVLGIVCVKIYPTDTPVWGIFFTIGINFVFLIPFTVLYSVTGFQLTMNVLVELIVGYALPGKANPHLILKSFGTQTDMQAQDYISNQKIGHYAKIPPWAAFRAQLLATFINLFISLAIINWQIDTFEGLCSPTQAQKFTCVADAQIYFTASVFWGVIGPKRVFNGLYPMLRWSFLIGFLLTFPCYAIFRVLPKRYRKWWQPTIIIGAMLTYFAPYNLSYLTGGVYLSILFMIYLKKNYLAWWEKYNYITTGGLTSGLALSSIILFFAVQYHEKDVNWWGNSVVSWGIEGGLGQQTLKDPSTAPDGYFGPRKGHFP